MKAGGGVRADRVLAGLVGVERAVVEAVVVEDDAVVVGVRARERDAWRCGVCGRRSPGYDGGDGVRRWRALDLGSTRAFIEAEAPRVRCACHGVVVVVRVRWARHESRFTRAFEQQVAWLATHCSKTAVCELMRIGWYTVGRIIERAVADERLRQGDPLEGLGRIGIDELSLRKGQRYITVVVDHDSGRLVWAREGRDKKTVLAFFDQLGPERAARIRLVSSDLGEWITRAVLERCPQATLCLDPYHVVALATQASENFDGILKALIKETLDVDDATADGILGYAGAIFALLTIAVQASISREANHIITTFTPSNIEYQPAITASQQSTLIDQGRPYRIDVYLPIAPVPKPGVTFVPAAKQTPTTKGSTNRVTPSVAAEPSGNSANAVGEDPLVQGRTSTGGHQTSDRDPEQPHLVPSRNRRRCKLERRRDELRSTARLHSLEPR